MTCGEKIKLKRKELKLSQTELAEKVGLKFGTISKYEKDKISIPANNLKLLADALNVSVDYLLGNTTIENPKRNLENTLSNYGLSESEYDFIMNKIINDKRISLVGLPRSGNLTKEQNVMSAIFSIYMDYSSLNLNDENDINAFKDNNESIDEKFIQMLKTLDKNKIISKSEDNVFPAADVPRQFPILGKISAGLPVLAVENIEGYDFAPSSKTRADYDYFFLRVQGDSMNEEFPDNCLLLVQRQSSLDEGQIGVFRINGDDATVKCFKKENDLVVLVPKSTNPIHKEQKYDPKKVRVEIIGKVISFTKDVN